jgi:hypothetical protein
MGFNQELAVVMEQGRIRPLTQSDIEKQTRIAVKNVHRCVLDLESEGWLLRKPSDEERGLRRGEVQIHCYAVPRPPKKVTMESETGPEADRYEGIAPELAYWLRHLKLGVPPAEKLEQALALAAGLSASVECFRELCRPEPDQMPLPGVPVNPVKAPKRLAALTELKPRGVETPLARGGQNQFEGLRAGRSDPRARALPNKEEIKEIKKTEQGRSVGRSVVPTTGSDRQTDSPTSAVSKAIWESGICAKLNDTPSPKLLEQITAKLNGGSVEYLKNRIHVRFDDITGLGMLEALAADVAASDGAPVGVGAPAPRETADLRRRREVVAGLEFMQKMRDGNG